MGRAVRSRSLVAVGSGVQQPSARARELAQPEQHGRAVVLRMRAAHDTFVWCQRRDTFAVQVLVGDYIVGDASLMHEGDDVRVLSATTISLAS